MTWRAGALAPWTIRARGPELRDVALFEEPSRPRREPGARASQFLFEAEA